MVEDEERTRKEAEEEKDEAEEIEGEEGNEIVEGNVRQREDMGRKGVDISFGEELTAEV